MLTFPWYLRWGNLYEGSHEPMQQQPVKDAVTYLTNCSTAVHGVRSSMKGKALGGAFPIQTLIQLSNILSTSTFRAINHVFYRYSSGFKRFSSICNLGINPGFTHLPHIARTLKIKTRLKSLS